MSKVLTAVVGALVALTVAGCGTNSGTSADASTSRTGGHSASSQASPRATASKSNHAKASKNNDDKAASKAVAHSFMASPGSGGGDQLLGLDHKDATCIGFGVVTKLGIHKLEKYGVISKQLNGSGSVDQLQLSPADAKATTDVLFRCTDVAGMIWKAVDKGGQVPARVRPCVRKALGEDALRPVFVQYFEGRKKAAQNSLVRPIMGCAQGAGS